GWPSGATGSCWPATPSSPSTAIRPCSSWPGRSSVSGWASADFPGVVAGQQGGEVTGTAPAPGRVDLLRHQLVVAGLLHLPEDADGGVPEVGRVQPRQGERVGRVGAVRVVGDQRVLLGRGHLYR